MSTEMRQTCKVCDRPDKFNFHVSDDVWQAVVPPEFQGHVVCLSCFDDFARTRNVNYAIDMSLWFAGDAATVEFHVKTAAPAGYVGAEQPLICGPDSSPYLSMCEERERYLRHQCRTCGRGFRAHKQGRVGGGCAAFVQCPSSWLGEP